RHPLELPSFPTRRSSDLAYTALTEEKEPAAREVRLKRIAGIVDRLLPVAETSWQRVLTALSLMELKRHDEAETLADRAAKADPRSEEHTSELQSRENLVC